MFNLGHYNEEFSSKEILESAPKFFKDPVTGFIVSEDSLISMYGEESVYPFGREGILIKDGEEEYYIKTHEEMDQFFDKVYFLFESKKID